jgi:AcrR family transcriptional regulator
MSAMSTVDLETGRTQQKRRTREALIAAARELIGAGEEATVERVADWAQISRTTAYRYFPNRRLLIAAAHPETTAASLLPPDAPADPQARLALVVEAFVSLIRATEPQQRAMLRISLEPVGDQHDRLPLRQGRAIGWIGEALAPLEDRLSEEQLHALVVSIRSAIGIEALVWLEDVAQLSGDDAQALMAWTARSLLGSALSDPPPTGADFGR